MNPPSRRLVGEPPRIGIRPAIDGRRNGVRESLEDRTMQMAREAARLISSSLRHAGGEPVECVIAETCIGGVAEAARCADLFSRHNVCATLTVTPCWCYGSETMDLDPLVPKAVWGFNGTERPGAVYLAAVMSAHNQRGLPAFSIYGRDVQDADDTSIPDDVAEKILRFARAALAVGAMKGRSYCGIGSVSMGIFGSFVDPFFFQKYLGMRAEWVDMSEITRRVEREIYDPAEYEKALAWVRAHCVEGVDVNEPALQRSRQQKDADWEYVVRMTLICRDILVGNPRLAELGFGEEALGRNAIAGGFQGQRMWTDHKPNGDFTEAILNSSFDWNGIREAFVFATENDSLNAVAMLFGHLLNLSPAVFADVRTYWSPEAIRRVTGWAPEGRVADGLIHLLNSGAAALDGCGAMTDADGRPTMKPYWDVTSDDVDACLDATRWCPANAGYFRGGGYSSQFRTRDGMPVTLSRLCLIDGQGPVLQIAEGTTVDLPDAVHETLNNRTDPTWPCTWFVPRLTGQGAFRSVYDVMANWGANHGAFSCGHIGADLVTLAAMLRIPVAMHNIPEERLFRPHAWSAFGTRDPEGSDFRACAAFGPLYGRR